MDGISLVEEFRMPLAPDKSTRSGASMASMTSSGGSLESSPRVAGPACGRRASARRSTLPKPRASAPRPGCRIKWEPVRYAAPDRQGLPVHVRGIARLRTCARLQVRNCHVISERPTLPGGGMDDARLFLCVQCQRQVLVCSRHVAERVVVMLCRFRAAKARVPARRGARDPRAVLGPSIRGRSSVSSRLKGTASPVSGGPSSSSA